ncbi:hypothetical protein [Bradyrhizobium sp. BR 10289]|uniref:hypothetical protein n=1 Tax=Bradyrhizobium sp. BR 10289 TaxID=2749993 RepID=UPI001C6471F5|nr:hypothetical protein [Bradyrhizobium sp. BR 10289]MBW7972224.1 hypothetical protein [Bradyrhizobium sp. BR 10289]
MAKIGTTKPSAPPKSEIAEGKAKKPRRLRDLDEDDDDGDIATPKRDRDGCDDEPL